MMARKEEIMRDRAERELDMDAVAQEIIDEIDRAESKEDKNIMAEAREFQDSRSRDERIPGDLDTTGFRNVEDIEPSVEDLDEWDTEKSEKLKKIHAELAANGPKVHDEKMKKDIATVTYEIVEDTPMEKDKIRERAYIISAFVEYEYDDELDEVFEIAATLVPPTSAPLKEQDIYYAWTEIYEMLGDYLSRNKRQRTIS